MRNLKRLFTGRRHRQHEVRSKRTRLPKADRGPVLHLTVGPAEDFTYTPSGITLPCWLIRFEGDGYADWWPCYSRQAVEQGLSLMRSAYPDATVTWLKELKDGNPVHAVPKAGRPPS